MKQIQITLTPKESKRIIAMGVKRLPVTHPARYSVVEIQEELGYSAAAKLQV